MSFGLFYKVSAWVLAAGTVVWAYDVTPPLSQWDFSQVKIPQVHLPEVHLADLHLPEIKLPDIKLPDLSHFSFGTKPADAPASDKGPDKGHETAVAAAAPAPKPAAPEAAEKSPAPPAAGPMSELPAASATPEGVLAERLLRDHSRDRLAGLVDWHLLRAFYSKRGYVMAWSGSPDAEAHAQQALATLRRASEQGLDPTDYFIGASALSKGAEPGNPASDYELLLSDGLLHYAHDVRVGRVKTNPADAAKAFIPQDFDAAAALADGLAGPDFAAFLADLPPRYGQYKMLVLALASYRVQASQAVNQPKIATDPPLDLDSSDPRLVTLRQRLSHEDANLSPVAPASGGADGLRGAIMRFQERNGLPADGFVGPDTLDMLNSGPKDLVAKIAANMERWRWLPHQFDARAIMVQVPEAKIRYIENGVVKFETRGIFGRPTDPSPALGVKISAVTVNPPWHAPESITVRELLPALREDPDLLREQNMTLVNGPPGDPYGKSINWNAVSAAGFPYGIRQRPGADSALGRIKFEMANNFTVYLHDTPDHWWFGQPVQALSHGCIRVDEPLPLASWVMSGSETASREKLDAIIKTGATQTIALAKPVPVYILYLTALAQNDGTVQFYPDLYKRDAKLIDELEGPSHMGEAGL